MISFFKKKPLPQPEAIPAPLPDPAKALPLEGGGLGGGGATGAEAEFSSDDLSAPPTGASSGPTPLPASPPPGRTGDASSAEAETEPKGWLSRLRQGLRKSAGALTEGLSEVFIKRRLDEATLDAFEELLILSDLGTAVASEIVAALRKASFDKEVTSEEVCRFLADEVTRRLQPVALPLIIDHAAKPHVILVVGVNGNGKTTTIGKMASQLKAMNYKVMMAAGDTFRAAAVEQLQVWGERTGCPVVVGAHEADAASVAYQALERAKAEGTDVLLIDTAGRLHNKANLMQELEKIIRVLKKLDPDAPHCVLQVLDATTGQNAVAQTKAFREMVNVSGLIVTKLDGTAKAGVIVALAQQFGIPIHAIGVGEGVADFREFDAREFAENLVGLGNASF